VVPPVRTTFTQRLAVCCLALTATLAGCGGSTPAIRTTPTAPVVTVGTPPTTLPTGLYPEADTPIAQAPAAMAQAWTKYGVTVIPSRHVFDEVARANSPVHVRPGVTLSADEAARAVRGLLRANALLAWGDSHHQPSLRAFLVGRAEQATKAALAVAQGAAVDEPACDLIPTAITVQTVDAATQQAFVQRSEPTTDSTAMLLTYGAPCVVQARFPDGRSEILAQWQTPLSTVAAGHLVNDPVLGELWVETAALACGGPLSPAAACAQLSG